MAVATGDKRLARLPLTSTGAAIRVSVVGGVRDRLGPAQPKAFGDYARRNLPPSAGAAAALVGRETRAPGQEATCKHVEQGIEVN
jgi:hypothetical protein